MATGNFVVNHNDNYGRVAFLVRLPPPLYQRLQTYAESEGNKQFRKVHLQEVVNWAIELYLREKDGRRE